LALLCATALGLARRVKAEDNPVQRSQEKDDTQNAAPAPLVASTNPEDFVQVRNGTFLLHGKPFVLRGTNYFGSWLHHSTFSVGNGVEHANIWSVYHDWNRQTIDADFRFIQSQLNATAIRIGTPSRADFAPLVQYHGYEPWFNRDGEIAENYKHKLVELADIAYANGIRVQLCLLWNVSGEITKDADAFKPGGVMDRFYSNQVHSIVMALRNHPGIIGYSIGNEVLVKWPINGTHRSWYEPLAAGFILRRVREVRNAAPLQLLASDEDASAKAKQWYAPGPEFAVLPAEGSGDERHMVRLADSVDYLGPHFYPEVLRPEDLVDDFARKIDDAKQQLAIYLKDAKAIGKPVVINEFGLMMPPGTTGAEQYSGIRDRYYQAIITQGQKLGLQGLLAWNAIPEIALTTGHYQVRDSKLNQYSQTEIDVDTPTQSQRRILFYEPRFNLFEWREDSESPRPTLAANAIASAWPAIPGPGKPRSLRR
jgi:hypothetical protein